MDELERVGELLPERPEPAPEAVAQARARLMNAVRHDHAVRGANARRAGRLGVLGLGAATVAAVAVAALILVPPALSGSLLGGGLQEQPAATAGTPAPSRDSEASDTRQPLLAAAQAARGGVTSTGLFWRVRSQTVVPLTVGTTRRYTIARRWLEETWTPAERVQGAHSLVGMRNLGAKPLTAQDEDAWRRDGKPTTWETGDGGTRDSTVSIRPGAATLEPVTARRGAVLQIGEVSLTLTELQGLPADSHALRTRLLDLRRQADVETSPEDWLFSVAGQLLARAPLAPGVRAATFELLADLPSVASRRGVRDQLGREGVAIERTRREKGVSSTAVLLIDPDSGQLLETRTTTENDKGILKDVMVVIVSAGWTNTRPAPP
ncbi:CU044_5270 family protein [Actinopolymorpha alba]|uniref:CU044_5270 family protein n=1 Tax=Actinopolymorpha alba TaxID=533267 RepID=UPI00035DCFAA|nr:CU044_5270 family protein [Actinopolymorpha alba]